MSNAGEPLAEVRSLSTLHKSQQIGVTAFSPDSRRFIMSVSDKRRSANSGVSVWTDGVKQDYTDFVLDSVVFSDDSQRCAFSVVNGNNLQYIVDGEPIEPTARFVTGLTFSPDGRNYAFAVSEGDQFRVVQSNGEGRHELFDSIQSLSYSTDGKRLGYMGFDRTQMTSSLVIDGKTIANGFKNFPKRLRIGTNTAMIALKRGEQSFLYDGKTLTGPFADIPFYGVSKNGEHTFHVITTGNSSQVFVDGRKVAEFDSVDSMVWSDHQSRALFVGIKKGRHFAYVNETCIGEAASITNLQPGVKRSVGYLARGFDSNHPDSWSVVIDGKVAYESPKSALGLLQLASAGRHWSCLALDQSTRAVNYVIDGKPSDEAYSDATQIAYSEDGSSFAYGMWRNDQYFIVTPTRQFGPFDANGSPPVLSPDGSHFAFFGTSPKGRGLIVDGDLLLQADAPLKSGGAPLFKSSAELNTVLLLREDGVFSYIGQVQVTWPTHK